MVLLLFNGIFRMICVSRMVMSPISTWSAAQQQNDEFQAVVIGWFLFVMGSLSTCVEVELGCEL